MAVKKYWLGVDSYNYDLSSDGRLPTVYLTIGDMELTLRDIPGVDSEVQLLDLEEHDQELKDRFIKVTRRVQLLPVNVRKELFGVPNVWDAMAKHSIDFIEGALDDYETVKVGDEVQAESGIDIHKLYIIVNESGECYTALEKGTGYIKALYKHLNSPFGYRKTGRHFEFIEQYCKKEGNK